MKNLPPGLCRITLTCVLLLATFAGACAALPETIARIKPAIVVVGTYNQTGSPPFVMRGTGFAVGEGKLIATNAHVVPDALGPDGTILVVQARVAPAGEPQLRPARPVAIDKEHDLAVLRIEGPALPRLALGNSAAVREGQQIAFTGFPIGGVLGFSPVTHRGIVSAVTPIALPSANARQLDQKVIRRIKGGAFNIFQLDATAYPGNSGSPVFDVETGEVIGVINMVFVKSTKEAVLSQPSGISYAIPADYLLDILRGIAP